VCYFVNREHCDIEFYMFQNASSYEVGAHMNWVQQF